ncbi:50S ribosomal protein L4 [bacterium]|nr:50S ribosomal protein L4 [candidate division CSSED10-310 bacterium]
MPKVQIKSLEGDIVGDIELPDDIFAVPYNAFPIQEVIRMQMANNRRGTHKTKERSEVAGSTRKLYRQKGTGRARAGSIKTPLRKGGGIIFGPKPRDYDIVLPKKVRRTALKIALSKKLTDGSLEVFRDFDVEQPKTKPLLTKLDPEKKGTKTLLILGGPLENVKRSLRNVPFFKVLLPQGLNVYDLVNASRVILMENSIPVIKERLQK